MKNGFNSPKRTSSTLMITKCPGYDIENKKKCQTEEKIKYFVENYVIELSYFGEELDFSKYGKKPTRKKVEMACFVNLSLE